MRSMHHLPALPAALLVGFLSVASLHAQEGAMKKDKGAMQDHASMAVDEPMAQGKLSSVGDHKASGTVHILNAEGKRQVHFTSDFSIEKGPDVYVLLTNGPKPVHGRSVTVAKLSRFAGEQSFEIPANTDLANYSHIVLWCRKYSVSMGQAELQAGEMMGDERAMIEKDEGSMMDEKKAGK
ncbi:MAG: DM13 domain-containing protein [Gemmatimonadales bacterium]